MSDSELRMVVFEWLNAQSLIHPTGFPRTLLQQGLSYQGARIPLIGPQGIFKPQSLELPLAITTTSLTRDLSVI